MSITTLIADCSLIEEGMVLGGCLHFMEGNNTVEEGFCHYFTGITLYLLFFEIGIGVMTVAEAK